jgi:hypothetical protein
MDFIDIPRTSPARDLWTALVLSLSKDEGWMGSWFDRLVLSEASSFDRLRMSGESKGSP